VREERKEKRKERKKKRKKKGGEKKELKNINCVQNPVSQRVTFLKMCVCACAHARVTERESDGGGMDGCGGMVFFTLKNFILPQGTTG
jgi:hypothetical protein